MANQRKRVSLMYVPNEETNQKTVYYSKCDCGLYDVPALSCGTTVTGNYCTEYNSVKCVT